MKDVHYQINPTTGLGIETFVALPDVFTGSIIKTNMTVNSEFLKNYRKSCGILRG